MTVKQDYLIDVDIDPIILEKEKLYATELAKIDLNLIGNSKDKISTEIDSKTILDNIDKAFTNDKGFRLSALLKAIQILQNWPIFKKEEIENTYYKATMEQLQQICIAEIEGSSAKEVNELINFLTLKQHEVIQVFGMDLPCDDLPVWEYRKRFSRYMIRPIITIGEWFYWGPYSIQKSGDIWFGRIINGSLPADISGSNINKQIDDTKTLIEKRLETKAYEIMQRFTQYNKINLWLHKCDKFGQHPLELGDYDVVGYFPDLNFILSVECKDLSQVYCMKDARRLRQQIFGLSNKKGYADKVQIRHDYLEKNCKTILRALSWPINEEGKIKVVSLFVSRHDYWWTRFPSTETDILFSRIDLLAHTIEGLISCT